MDCVCLARDTVPISHIIHESLSQQVVVISRDNQVEYYQSDTIAKVISCQASPPVIVVRSTDNALWNSQTTVHHSSIL